jgi:hypothetical protein
MTPLEITTATCFSKAVFKEAMDIAPASGTILIASGAQTPSAGKFNLSGGPQVATIPGSLSL